MTTTFKTLWTVCIGYWIGAILIALFANDPGSNALTGAFYVTFFVFTIWCLEKYHQKGKK